MAMAAIPIVKDFDVVKDVRSCQITRLVDAFLDTFLFQATKEGFGDCVVPTIATSAHAGLELMRVAEALPIIASVLRPLI